MKTREDGFLADNKISHASDAFDYIRELHKYLWRVIRAVQPGAGGFIPDFLDDVVKQIEQEKSEGRKASKRKCKSCGHLIELGGEVDMCEKCDKAFGNCDGSCGDPECGNQHCQHCGHNTYYQICPECGEDIPIYDGDPQQLATEEEGATG